MSQQKNILFFLITIFILASIWLFYFSNNILNQNEGKNWWAIYFENPKSADFNFVIENHSDKNNFHWVVSADNSKLNEGDATIEKGYLLNLNPIVDSEIENKKIIIQVLSGDEKKEIYKNL
jgi:hypothetical protein